MKAYELSILEVELIVSCLEMMVEECKESQLPATAKMFEEIIDKLKK